MRGDRLFPSSRFPFDFLAISCRAGCSRRDCRPTGSVCLYRVRAPIENLRRFFMDYIRQINALAERPAFYNTLTTNCTTNLLLHTRVHPGHPRYSWQVLLSGYLPEYAYEEGRLDTRLPFEELRKRSRINAVAEAADAAPDFSQRIRAGLPDPMEVNAEAGVSIEGLYRTKRARSLHGIGS